MMAWFLSHKPFWKGLSAAVVKVCTLRMLATSLISSELNSPPLSVKMLPITPKPAPTQQVMILSITSQGLFREMNTDTENRENMSIRCKIHLSPHFFKSILTTSLKLLAIGNATAGLSGVLLYTLHSSHLRYISSRSSRQTSFHAPASFNKIINFFCVGWVNCRWSLSSALYLSWLLTLFSCTAHTDETLWFCQYSQHSVLKMYDSKQYLHHKFQPYHFQGPVWL